MQPIVTLQHISVVYDHEKPVLTDVNLTIYDRDFIGVIGPNGGGKTTLVKTILKSLTYTGEVIYSPEIESKGYRRIGYLPQTAHIDRSFPISVSEVVLSGLQSRKKLWGRYSSQDRERAVELLDICGIADLKNRPIGTLSGGQMQRVAIARALVNNPAVILADEATGNLDTRTSFEILVLFQKLHAEGRTIIFVTHNPELAQYSSRNIRLRDGHVIEDTVNTHILSAAEALAALPKNDED